MNKKSKFTRVALLLLVAVPVVYILGQLAAIGRQPYTTQTAIQYTLSDSIQLEGVACFEEQPVEGSGRIGYLVTNGERVSAGAPVAELYQDAGQAQSRARQRMLEHQIELLQRAQDASDNDVGVHLAQAQAAVYDLLDAMDQHRYEDLQAGQDRYITAHNRLQMITGQVPGFEASLQELTAQRDQLAAQFGEPQVVTAPLGGYFVDAAQGKSISASRQQLESASPTQLSQMLEDGLESPLEAGVGKIVTTYRWQFYGVCPARDTRGLEVGTRVEISFPGKMQQPLPAQVTKIEVDDAAQLAKLTVECEYMGSEVLSMGQQLAQLDFASYEGLRISAEAVHIEDGVKGVYVQYGNLIKFRRIEILYQNEDYVLVPLDGGPDGLSELRRFDEVIVKGTDLEDGKLL